MIQMTADLKRFFDMQWELDDYIIEKHDLDLQAINDERVLSIFDEICELMNKMRFHKYWSNNPLPKVSRDDLIEEYVDTWHFILSIGNEIQMTTEHNGLDIRVTFAKQFRACLFVAHDIYTPIGWTLFVSLWKGLAYMMNFTDEEVVAAYERKYQVNIERQKNEY
jgi:dimeric dUTPase (all-alpha-NTP-PPase superfamily)